MTALRRAFATAALLLVAPGTLPALQGPPATEQVRLDGLERSVEIVRDRWGIAHIYAETEHDLFFAQGYNVARDRLFQLEIWRRQATGTLAEIQGRAALERDIGARLLRFRGDMDAELRHYHPRGDVIIPAFVRGINAYIAETERNPDLLPLEFRVLGITPGRWTDAVVISRHNGLYRNITQELSIARLVAAAGEAVARELLDFGPGRPSLAVDPFIDPAAVPDDVLARYGAARSGVTWREEDIAPSFRRAAGDAGAAASASPFTLAAPEDAYETWLHGSNNWIVAGSRTATRSPFMANDPHRAVTVPSLRYWVHLVGPGWNVIGGGEPALPGVSIGHNEHGAWGLTIFSIDQEDLYVYETNPADPGEYRYAGSWETMRVVYDTVRVRGEGDVVVPLRFTRHGPVLYEDSAAHRAYALRAAWLEVGGAPYLASLRMNQATTWEEFQEACRWSYTPSENMIWADTSGTIGWQAVGIAPVRRGWDGLVPVPGDGRFEWDGYLDPGELPSVVDPAAGWFATANENNVPHGYAHTLGVSGWADPARYNRIAEVLDSGTRFTLGDMMALQHDELSLHARALVRLLLSAAPSDADLQPALELLRGWDHVLAAGSAAAALYRTWEPIVSRAVWQRSVPPSAEGLSFGRPLRRAVDWLHAPDARFGANPVAGRDSLLAATLREALAATRERFGADPGDWRYGDARMKHVRLRHALSALVDSATAADLDLGPLPRGGSGTTVNMTGDGMNQTSGASFRIIANLADWDLSVGTNTPGQSGNPDSDHYADLFEPWAAGRYFPVLYSRDRIEMAASAVTRLLPGSTR